MGDRGPDNGPVYGVSRRLCDLPRTLLTAVPFFKSSSLSPQPIDRELDPSQRNYEHK